MNAVKVGAVAACVLILAGCAATPKATPKPKPFSFTGTLTVPIDLSATLALEDNDPTIGEPCQPDDGYDDIDEGAQVVVSDAAGKKVAIGTLSAGALAQGPDGDKFFQSVCKFNFDVEGVPNKAQIYSVHIGNQARGDESFTRSQLKAGIALTLGQ